MNRIDRLIIKARESIGVELILAMVERRGDEWRAAVHLGDRRRHGSPVIEESTHAALDAAIDHIHALAKEYPNSQDVQIIVDDISMG